MWVAHPAEAKEADIPRERTKCPELGCKYTTRSDNLLRHLETVHKVKQPRKRKGKGK
jgi:hypothetical protein